MPADREPLFYDTNVLLYLLLPQSEKARRLDPYMVRGGVVSVQVLNEFTNVARRKNGLDVIEIVPFLKVLRDAFEVVPVTVDVHDRALDIIQRYRLSTYDATIVACALIEGCTTLLSEDLHHGLVVDGKLKVVNPFRD
ncbi:MAG: PIN domain-containing protein [Mesorhizobium sp.]|nr:PIN domain-containing protein [Mesorhizobium sp.]MCO5160410.1 PIN domain-containing protein [Mesorhizobium sp.]